MACDGEPSTLRRLAFKHPSPTTRFARLRFACSSGRLTSGLLTTESPSHLMPQRSFSSGNITERRRIGALDMSGETVVDAYAGVGYYAFPMLIHSGAARVHACEINPTSLEGLRAGAEANGLTDRLVVHEGDREQFSRPSGPSRPMPSRFVAVQRGRMGGVFAGVETDGWDASHPHERGEERIEAWSKATVARFRSLVEHHGLSFSVNSVHLERVKWFAPRVRHVVLDLNFRP